MTASQILGEQAGDMAVKAALGCSVKLPKTVCLSLYLGTTENQYVEVPLAEAGERLRELNSRTAPRWHWRLSPWQFVDEHADAVPDLEEAVRAVVEGVV